MRSKDFYYGPIRSYLTNMFIIMVGGGVPFTAIIIGAIFISNNLNSDTGVALSTLGLIAVATAIGLIFSLLFARWQIEQAYNAWKVTFEEDWKPKPRYFEKMIQALTIQRDSSPAKQSAEV